MAHKYVADGFQSDAESLLKQFTFEESNDFKVFASIWRKKKFSFIYMGRDSVKEMGEFTSEIFAVTLSFLESESYWQQIGAVFLLYCLDRNQILNPPVRIRVELAKFEVMKRLLHKAIADKLYSLHYVLEYLFKNPLELVASPTLLGPCVQIFDRSKCELEKKLRMSDFKCNLEELYESKVLEGLSETFLKYKESKSTPGMSDTNKRCNELISIMKRLTLDQTRIDSNGKNSLTPSARNRSRRANKVACEYPFFDSDCNQTSEVDELSENDESESLENSVIKNKGGRGPLECDEEQEEAILVTKPMPKPKKPKKPRRRVVKTRRIRKYYEGSPTRVIPCTKATPLKSDSEDEFLAGYLAD